MTDFNKDDVITLAKAVVADPLGFMCGDYTPYYYCVYCDAELKGYNTDIKNFKHELKCPVLIAQNILTGMEK